MTIALVRPATTPQPEPTAESEHVAKLRAMLDDPAEQTNWPEIRAAIAYLTATSTRGA